MKRKTLKSIVFLLSIILIILLVLCVELKAEDGMNTVYFATQSQDSEDQISLYYNSGKYYAFLPSYADFTATKIVSSSGYGIYLDDIKYSQHDYCDGLKLEKEYNLKLTNILGFTIAAETLVIMRSKDVPSMSIYISDGYIEEVNNDRNVSKKGFVQVVKSDKTVDYSGEFKDIHIRGNVTSYRPKKSYTLEMPENVDLLGMGCGKKWILVSNTYDESGLRNKLAYDLAKEIGVKYAVDSNYIDLYIDGQYSGLYLLTEKIEVGESRVDINNLENDTQLLNDSLLDFYDKIEIEQDGKWLTSYNIPNNPEDITGGYLLQIDNHPWYYKNKMSSFQTEHHNVEVSSPKYASQTQIEYISDFCKSLESDLVKGNLNGIDLISFVNYYLVQEVLANTDSSSYFYFKDSSNVSDKIYAGPIWDFDLSLGNGWCTSDINPKVLYTNKTNWFDYIYNNIEFQELLQERYINNIRPIIESFVNNKLDSYSRLICNSFKMDKIRWGNVAQPSPTADESQKRFDSIEEHVDRIKLFMEERIEFLDDAWIGEVEFYTVSFVSENPYILDYYSVQKGKACNIDLSSKTESTDKFAFAGWFDESGSEYIQGQVITSDKYYTAKWVPIDSSEVETSKEKDQVSAYDTGTLKTYVLNFMSARFTYMEIAVICVVVGTIVCLDIFNHFRRRRKKYDRRS